VLFSVAESAEWLFNKAPKDTLSNKNIIEAIIADDTHKKTLENLNKKITIRSLRWWLHNQHMTIFINSKTGNIKSIYFTRKLRSSNINPVLLEEKKDNIVLLRTFFAYRMKSHDIEKSATEPLIEDKYLNKEITKYLEKHGIKIQIN
jgi:hypothetical protein